MMEFKNKTFYYYLLEQSRPRKVVHWITILILTLLFLFFFSYFFHYTIYQDYQGTVLEEGGEYYVHVLVEEDSGIIPLFSKEILVNKRDEKAEIIAIGDPFYAVDRKKYRQLELKVPLEEGEKVQNNQVIISVEKESTTIWKKIKQEIKKGFLL